MGARAQAILPLALVIGVLSAIWTWFSLNFTFHWVTVEDNVFGPGSVGIPENFHLILPTAFISWGLFFAAGGDNAAVGKISIAALFGVGAAMITMPLAFTTAMHELTAESTEAAFWGITLWVGVFAFILVAILILGDWYYVAGTFPCFAATFLWWIATGLDGWLANGGGKGDPSLLFGTDPAPGPPAGATAEEAAQFALDNIAGFGAGAGLISTPWQWVAISTFVTLICGVILGFASGKIAAMITPKPKAAEA